MFSMRGSQVFFIAHSNRAEVGPGKGDAELNLNTTSFLEPSFLLLSDRVATSNSK